MFEKQPEAVRKKVKFLAELAIQRSDPSSWFELLYAEAGGDSSQVPWARLSCHPYLQDWLETNQTKAEGKSALVIGCGLGDDAEALASQGFRVTAFDISPTAIAWCRERFSDSSVNYLVADLFSLEPTWHHRFDLVFESRNLQALPLSVRSKAIQAVASLVAPRGTLLAITRFRETEAEPDGPPWPLSDRELTQFKEWGLLEIRRDQFSDADNNSVKKLRIEYGSVH